MIVILVVNFRVRTEYGLGRIRYRALDTNKRRTRRGVFVVYDHRYCNNRWILLDNMTRIGGR